MESNRREPFDWQPHLVGDLNEVRPLRPSDWDNLFAVASDALIWEQHPAHDRYKEEVFSTGTRHKRSGRRGTSGSNLKTGRSRSAGRFWPARTGAVGTTPS
jgi:hypothetical protein